MPLWNESSVSCFKMAQPVTVASYYNKMGHVQPQKYAQFDTLRASHQPTSKILLLIARGENPTMRHRAS